MDAWYRKNSTVVPVRIIFWTIFLIIIAVTIYRFLSVMSGGVRHVPYETKLPVGRSTYFESPL